uniref:Transmembrane protein n=1 Tax=Steinernema glaseri TaxID=37863 RepID=A0A1I7Z3B2_9BILA
MQWGQGRGEEETQDGPSMLRWKPENVCDGRGKALLTLTVTVFLCVGYCVRYTKEERKKEMEVPRGSAVKRKAWLQSKSSEAHANEAFRSVKRSDEE